MGEARDKWLVPGHGGSSQGYLEYIRSLDPAWQNAVQAAKAPRAYYVAAHNGQTGDRERLVLLVGPWLLERDARDLIYRVRRWLIAENPRNVDWVIDVASFEIDREPKPGALNRAILDGGPPPDLSEVADY
jgi:hypothetical protein